MQRNRFEQLSAQDTGIVAPVIEHAAKIAALEQMQASQYERITHELEQVQGDVMAEIEASLAPSYERIEALENQVSTLLSQQKNAPAKTPAVTVKEPPANTRYIRRNGRKLARTA